MPISTPGSLTSRWAIGVVAALAAVSFSMTACGNEATSARDFFSYANYQDFQMDVSGQPEDVIIAVGALQPEKGGAFAPGTLFRESCTRPVVDGAVYVCIAVINTGQRVYVARSATLDPIERHTLAIQSGHHGSVTVKSVGAGLQSHDVEISLRP